jgi:hypothetical protein
MKTICGISLLFLAAASAQAQTGQGGTPAPRALIELSTSAESTVKGAPFSAEAVSESVQTLADGNRIVRKSTSKLYRNGQGQFRREGGFGFPGATFGAVGVGGSGVTVLDPVGGNRFWFDTDSKTARVFTVPGAPPRPAGKAQIIVEGEGSNSPAVAAASDKIQAELRARGAATVRVLPAESLITATAATAVLSAVPTSKYETRSESLGIQNFDGVDAEGTRTITTIPADAIGNERPIEIVYEKWYSKELHMIVYSKHSDPRFGEQTYRLTNINRSEPDPSLFEVPPGYKVVGEPGSTTIYKTSQSRIERPATQQRTTVRSVNVKNATSAGSRP